MAGMAYGCPVARAGLVVAGIAGVVSARDTERSPQSDDGTA